MNDRWHIAVGDATHEIGIHDILGFWAHLIDGGGEIVSGHCYTRILTGGGRDINKRRIVTHVGLGHNPSSPLRPCICGGPSFGLYFSFRPKSTLIK